MRLSFDIQRTPDMLSFFLHLEPLCGFGSDFADVVYAKFSEI